MSKSLRRTSSDLYKLLNRPSPTREPRKEKQKINPRVSAVIEKNMTQTLNLINPDLCKIDTVTKEVTKKREDELEAWIEENQPDNLDILRKIAEISPYHSRIMTTIVAELRTVLPTETEEENNESEKNITRTRNYKNKTYDLIVQTEKLRKENEEFRAKLNELKKKKEEIKNECNVYERLIDQAGFSEYEQEIVEENENMKQKQKEYDHNVKQKKANMFNQLWGANRHLRNEIEKMNDRIADQRRYHNEYTHKVALEEIAAHAIQEVEIPNAANTYEDD